MNIERNTNGVELSLLVSILGDILLSPFSLPNNKPFLLKNNTDTNITCKVKLANMNLYVTTVIYPGWNPELCIEVLVDSELLQYGN